MVETLQALRGQAEEFQKTRRNIDVLCISVVHIGYNLVMDYASHQFVKQLGGWSEPPRGQDGSRMEQLFSLTAEGEVVCLPEHSVNIANAGGDTYVIVLQDWDAAKRQAIKEKHVTTDGK